jgi:hypothetical protein
MALHAEHAAITVAIREAASELASSDVISRLRDEISDHFRGTQSWGYFVDYFGDAESGDVIYQCNGDTYRAPYSISQTGAGAAKATIDFDQSEDVAVRTVYETEADEADHLAAMEESKRDNLYSEFPVYERFISKAARDKASHDDFAGKGRSFPILKPEDIMAAVHAMGRAGSGNLGPSGIKSRIIAIAKRKGWEKYLPKAWQAGADAKESATGTQAADLKLVESSGAEFLTDLKLIEARSVYPVKLISPGTGSTAHYPAAVLEASADKFKAGTLMFWNHPTMAEESARPEGNLDNLAAILTSNARWDANGAKGPGLYAEAKVMADYAQKVEERAPHIGLSIRAGGKGTGRLVEGKPELASIDYVESVDYVTKAGRGGLALAEAARDAGILDSEERGNVEMNEAEIKRLIEAGIAAATAPLQERARRGDATVIAHRALATIGFTEAQKSYVVDTVLRETIPTKDGAVDADALTVLVNTEAKRLGAILGGNVRGFNVGTELAADPIKIAEARIKARAEEKESLDEFAGIFQELGLSEAASKKAAEGRAN